ncbi:Dipeptide transport system permease protein DppC [Candidatus Paraburkholderia kirkii]|nr:Dipeptide transport system permease protein DppC [Candidatus Paraburkholderia kirkii]
MPETPARTAARRRQPPWRRLVADFARSPTALAASGVAMLLVLAAIFAPLITPQNPYDLLQLDVLEARLPPGSMNGAGTHAYWFGTDGQGRDLYSAMLYGLRLSLSVGLGSAFIAGVIGTVFGLIAAYVGGKTDSLIMRFVDLLLAFLGKSVTNVVLTLVLIEWAYYARTARAQALVEARREYVEAARSLAIPNWRIVLAHILPNCLPSLIVVGTLQVARAITLEATLSFLGLGVPITEPSLGLLIANGYQTMLSGEYWISVYPGLVLLAILVSINMVGDRLRTLLNPRFAK